MTNSMFGQGQKRVCSWDYSHSSDPKKIRLNYSESQPLDDRQRLRHGPILERSRNNQYVAGICKGKLKTSAFNNSYVQRMQQVQPSFSEKTGTRQMAPYKETNTISGIIPNSQNSFSLIDKSISEQRMLPRQSVGLQKGEGQFKTSETSHHRQSVTSFKVKQDDNSSQGCYSGFSQENYKAGASRFDVHNSRGSSFDSRMQPFQLNTYGKYDKASSHWVDNPCNKGSSLCLDDETSKRCDSQYDTHSSQWKNPSSQSSSQHGQSYKESDSLYGKKPPEWNEDSSCQQNLQYKDSYKRYVSWYCEKPSALNVDPSNWPELQYKASFLKYDGWDGEKPSQGIDDSSNWQSSQYGNNSKKYGSQYSENHPEWNDEPQSQSSQYDVTYNKCDTGCVERLPDGNDLPSTHQGLQYGVNYKTRDTGYGEKLPDRNDVCSSHQSSQYGVNYKRCDTGYGEKLPDRNDVCNNKRCDTGYGEKLSDRNDVCSSHHSLLYDVNYKRCDTRYGERLPGRNEVYSSHQRSQYDVNYKRCDTGYGDKLPDRNEFPISNQSSQYGDGDKKNHNQHIEKQSEWNSNPSVHQISQSGDSCKKSCSQNRDSKEPSNLQNVVGGTPETSYEKLKIQSGVPLENTKKISPSTRSSSISSQRDIPIGLGENVSNMETAKQCFQMALKNILEMPCEKLKAGISIEDNRKLIEVPLGYSRKQSLCEKLDRLIQFAKLTCFTNDGLIDNIDKVIKSIPLNASVLFTPSELQQNQILCDFYINGTYIASGQDSDRYISQQKAYKTAWTTLGSSQASDFTRAKLIIFESTRLSKKKKETAFSIINTSALMCGVKFKCTCKRNPTGQTGAENNYIAETFIGDELIATNYGENEEKAKNNVGFTVWQQFSKTHPVIQIVSDLEADAANWITYEEIVRKSKEMVTGRMYFPSFMQRSTQVILDFINDLAEKETIRQLIIAPDMPKSEKHEILQYIKNMPYLQLEKRSSDAGEYTVIFWKSLPVSFILDALKDASNIKSARYRYAPYSVINSKVEMDVSFTDSSNIKELKSNSESEMDASKNPEANSKGIVFSKHWCNNQQKSEDNDLVGETNSDLKTAKSGFKDSVRPRSKLPSKKSNSTGLKSHLISRVGSSDRYKSDTKSRDSNLRESSSSRHKSGSLARRESTRLESDKGRSLDRYRSYTRSRHSNQSEGASSRHKSGSAASLKSYKAGGSDRYKSDTRSRDSVSDKFKSHSDFGRRKPRKKKSFNTVPYIPDPKLMKQGFYKSSCSTIKGSMGNNLVSLCADSVSGRNKSCSNPQKEESSTIAVASDIKHRSDSQQKSEDNNPVTRSDSDLSEGEILSEDDDVSIPNVIVLDDEFVSSCPDSVSARNKSDSDSPKEENGTIAAPSDIKHESDSQQKSEDNNPVTQSDSDLSEGEILSEDDDVSISNVIVLDDI